MADRKVEVKNMSNATVTLCFRNSNFKRVLRGEGARIEIPFDTLYDGLSEPGVDVMFSKGYLAIPNKQDRIDLGLETEFSDVDLDKISMSSKDMLELLKNGSPVDIKATLEELSEDQKVKFANVAIDNNIYSAGIAKLIQDYTGINLAKAIADKEEDN